MEAELSRKRRLLSIATAVQASDFNDLRPCQLAYWRPFASQLTTLAHLVIDVVLPSAETEMSDFVARRVVTNVHDLHTCWLWSVDAFPLRNMSELVRAILADPSVSILCSTASPLTTWLHFFTLLRGAVATVFLTGGTLPGNVNSHSFSFSFSTTAGLSLRYFLNAGL